MGGHRAQSLIRDVGEYNIMHNTKANNKISGTMLFGKANQSLSVTLRHFQRTLNPWNAPRMLSWCACAAHQVSTFSKLMKYDHLNNGYCWYCLWNHVNHLSYGSEEEFFIDHSGFLLFAVSFSLHRPLTIDCVLYIITEQNTQVCLTLTHASICWSMPFLLWSRTLKNVFWAWSH